MKANKGSRAARGAATARESLTATHLGRATTGFILSFRRSDLGIIRELYFFSYKALLLQRLG